MLQMHRLELCWTDRKSEFSPTVKRKLRSTSSRLIMTEEVRKLGEILKLKKKNFTALKLKNVNNEINNFFLNGYRSKIRNYLKLIKKSQ